MMGEEFIEEIRSRAKEYWQYGMEGRHEAPTQLLDDVFELLDEIDFLREQLADYEDLETYMDDFYED